MTAERPTPETDAVITAFSAPADYVAMRNHARKLERQRDELRDALQALLNGRPTEEPPLIAKIAHRNWELFEQGRAAIAKVKGAA